MIYRPAETMLAAREPGSRAAVSPMALACCCTRARRALEIWSGQTAPVAAMRRALEENVYGRK